MATKNFEEKIDIAPANQEQMPAVPETERPIPEEELKAFRDEMRILKEAETNKKSEAEKTGKLRESYNPNLESIVPEEFTDEQAKKAARIYEKFKNKTLTFDEFNNARNEAFMSVPRDKNPYEDSVVSFYAYLGGEVMKPE